MSVSKSPNLSRNKSRISDWVIQENLIDQPKLHPPNQRIFCLEAVCNGSLWMFIPQKSVVMMWDQWWACLSDRRFRCLEFHHSWSAVPHEDWHNRNHISSAHSLSRVFKNGNHLVFFEKEIIYIYSSKFRRSQPWSTFFSNFCYVLLEMKQATYQNIKVPIK